MCNASTSCYPTAVRCSKILLCVWVLSEAGWKKKKSDTFSIYACHPCAGAMLIFSVSVQLFRMLSLAGSKEQWCFRGTRPVNQAMSNGRSDTRQQSISIGSVDQIRQTTQPTQHAQQQRQGGTTRTHTRDVMNVMSAIYSYER